MAEADWVDDPPIISDSDSDWVDDSPAEERPWYSFDPRNLGTGAMEGLKKIDEYAGAPIRKFVTETVTGRDMQNAPTGADQAKMMGATDVSYGDYLGLPDWVPGRNISPADIYGVGLETVQDPVMIAGGALKGATGIAKGLTGAVESAAGKMGRFAEKAAVNATGATGKQAANFADNAGRELLDRGIVQFGDSQEKIAGRAANAVNSANTQIDSSLAKLDAGGGRIDGNQIYADVRAKIQSMKADPSQADIANMLEKELDNLINATDAKGTSDFGFSEAEKVKRGYNRKAGNWADPEKGIVGKEMYQTYRGAVENAAEAVDPATAALFKEGKESYGLLRPIEEAAERRAATTAQSPVGGIQDVITAASGMAAGDPSGGILSTVGRRMAGPRISSSVAVGANNISEVLKRYPQALGKFANILKAAEARGPQGVAATHFILMQTNPEYRQTLQRVSEEEE